VRINILTIFPAFFAAPLSLSIPGRAAQQGLVQYRVVDLREFTRDRHRTVDDYPFGGGAGMVMKPEPFFEAVDALSPAGPIVLLSARGRVFTHRDAVRLAVQQEVTLLCGHYKDVDQRVADGLATEELSLGNFVLSGGEIPALAIVDAVVRLLPGALGSHDSAATDSFYDDGLLSAPSYTRPAVYRGMTVPEVLLSGDHERVAAWRRWEAERLTRERRPELWAAEPDEGQGSAAAGGGASGSQVDSESDLGAGEG
jgi:tRNA (guanine37-N1)-methyltransferase